jgi:8-oxo-dGTP pyrophosphatase MutT (NUDIX family)
MPAQSVQIRPAATILLVRDDPEFQVLMVQRHRQTDFVSGALVFPGGKTHSGDYDAAWSDWVIGWDGLEAGQRALRIAAVREVYEEVGILLAQDAAGRPYKGDDRAHAARSAVARNDQPFLDLVQALDVRLDLTALTVFARWITPNVVPKRFDTWFYLTRATGDQLAVCDGLETVATEWLAPAEAIQMAASGEREIVFPTRMNLQLLAAASNSRDAVARATARPHVTVEPVVERRDEGWVIGIPADAGYGVVSEPVSNLGTARARSRVHRGSD